MGEVGRTTLTVGGQGPGKPGFEKKAAGLTPKAYQELKSTIHRELLNRVDLEKLMDLRDGRARSQIFSIIQDLVTSTNTPMSGMERERLSREVLDEVFGLGPLEPLLQDPTINDILVNTHKQVYVERAGILEVTNVRFKDDAHLMHIIDKIVSAVGRRVDESSPMVDARLMDGSRVNVIIPPLAIDGAIMSIRRFGADAGIVEGRGQGPVEHSGFRRHGRWQDHAAQHPLGLHFR
jgi:pilus assembly protein CpaF